MSQKMTTCKACNKEIAKSAKTCPHCGAKNKKPIFTKWWFWLIVVVVIGVVAGAGSGSDSNTDNSTSEQKKIMQRWAVLFPYLTVIVKFVHLPKLAII